MPNAAATGPHTHELGHHLHRKQQSDDAGASRESGRRHEQSRAEDEERREQGEGDGPHPVDEHSVLQEHAGDDQPGDVGGKHGLAARGAGEAAKAEEDKEQKLDLRFAHSVADSVNEKASHTRQQQQHNGGHHDENEAQQAVGREQAA